MPYKAVCEELWSICEDALGALRYREKRGKAAFCGSQKQKKQRRAATRGHTWGVALTCQQGFRCRSATSAIYALRLTGITARNR
jgi:hypothetical protein